LHGQVGGWGFVSGLTGEADWMVLLALRHQMIGVWNHGFRWFADRRLRCVHCGRRVGLLLEPGGAPLLL
jgi:hypothetical protein